MRICLPFAAIFLVVTSSGCATYDRVARPPSSAEVARINAAAHEGGTFAVRYVQPLEPCARPSTAAPAPLAVDAPTGLTAVDETNLIVTTAKGPPVAVPLSAVSGVSVSGQNRRHGAVIGGLVGAGSGLVLDVALYTVAYSMNGSQSDGGGNTTCGGDRCVLPFTMVALTSTLIGAGIGALVGSKTVFTFDEALAARRPAL